MKKGLAERQVLFSMKFVLAERVKSLRGEIFALQM